MPLNCDMTMLTAVELQSSEADPAVTGAVRTSPDNPERRLCERLGSRLVCSCYQRRHARWSLPTPRAAEWALLALSARQAYRWIRHGGTSRTVLDSAFSLAPPGALLRTLVAPYSALSTREIAE